MQVRRKILFISHTVDRGTFKVGSHHLARELARQGHLVGHMSTPVSVAHRYFRSKDSARLALAVAGPRVDEYGVVHFIPSAILPMKLAENRVAISAEIVATGFEDADLLFVDQPLLACIAEMGLKGTLIYRPTDEYSSGVARRRQRRIIDAAAGVVATSERVLQSLGLPDRLPRAVIENGVEYSRFADGAEETERWGCVYAGALDSRFDWRTLSLMAEAAPDEPFVIVGPTPRRVPSLPDNVELRGAVAYDELPAILRRARIGLIPLTDHPMNAGRSPMKYYEYLAAGLHVMAKETPTLRARNAPGVSLYSDGEQAVAGLLSLRSERRSNRAGSRAARDFDWAVVAARLMERAAAFERTAGGRHF